jgi:hypothetical protein
VLFAADVGDSGNVDAIRVGERDRHCGLVAQWQEAIEKVVELPTGYAFCFAPETAILMGLAEFISRERLCCPFFHFEIVVEANGGPVWLRFMGGEEVKTFVREALAMA